MGRPATPLSVGVLLSLMIACGDGSSSSARCPAGQAPCGDGCIREEEACVCPPGQALRGNLCTPSGVVWDPDPLIRRQVDSYLSVTPDEQQSFSWTALVGNHGPEHAPGAELTIHAPPGLP